MDGISGFSIIRHPLINGSNSGFLGFLGFLSFLGFSLDHHPRSVDHYW
jgi:hypothetical protein